MRICIFGSEIGLVKKDVFVGGSTVSAVRLAQALHSLGDEIFILSSSPRGRSSRYTNFKWGSIVNKRIKGRYMSFPYLLFTVFSFFNLMYFCRQKKMDIINTHAGTFSLSFIPRIMGKILKTIVINTQYCELITDNTLSNSINRASTFLSKLLARIIGISLNVCVSLVRSAILINKVSSIHPVVPIQQSKNLSDLKYTYKYGLDKKNIVVLFVGNLKANKGIDLLFEAFSMLAPIFPKKYCSLPLFILLKKLNSKVYSSQLQFLAGDLFVRSVR